MAIKKLQKKKRENRTPEDISANLAEIYDSEFAGKESSNFKISKADMRTLSGRTRLEKPFLELVNDELSGFELHLVDWDDYFVILDTERFVKLRKVPSKMIDTIMG
jgi:hypothetical protein